MPHLLGNWIQNDPNSGTILVLSIAVVILSITIVVITMRAWLRHRADRHFYRLYGFVPHRLNLEQQQSLVIQRLGTGLTHIKQLQAQAADLERQLEEIRADVEAAEHLQRERIRAARRRGFAVEQV